MRACRAHDSQSYRTDSACAFCTSTSSNVAFEYATIPPPMPPLNVPITVNRLNDATPKAVTAPPDCNHNEGWVISDQGRGQSR